MRVALVTETYPPEVNGVAMTLSRLTGELRALGHTVFVVRPRQRGDRKAGCPSPDTLLVPGLPIPNYPELRMGMPAYFRLKHAWSHDRPDVVHVATEGPLGLSAVLAARGLGIPVVSTFHSNFHEYCTDYGWAWIEQPVTLYLKYLHNLTLCSMTPDPGLIGQLEALGFENLRLLSRGVDTKLFDPARRDSALRQDWGLGPDDLAVIHVSRVAREKNMPLVLEAFRLVKQIEPRARLVIVGDGPDMARTRSLAGGLDPVFTGMLYGEDLARHYASADLFLFGSRTETFGNVVTEGLASGLLVGCYDYAAGRQFVRHEENGFVAAAFCETEFLSLARRLAHSWRSLSHIRQAARQTALTNPWSRVVGQYLQSVTAVLPSTGNAELDEDPLEWSTANS